MHRFFLPPEHCAGACVRLDERDSHHASRVLRLEVGEVIEVLDGLGQRLRVRVSSVAKRAVHGEVLSRQHVSAAPRVVLIPAVLKGKGMDFLVQKATELGATEIWPTWTERTVVHVSGEEAEAKAGGWRETAVEACKQCGNPWLPRIAVPRPLAVVLAEPLTGLGLVASLEAEARLPWEILADRAMLSEGLRLFTGPEGDYTESEYADLRARGVRAVTLGPLVLRAETAVIAALAILQHEYRRLGGFRRAG